MIKQEIQGNHSGDNDEAETLSCSAHKRRCVMDAHWRHIEALYADTVPQHQYSSMLTAIIDKTKGILNMMTESIINHANDVRFKVLLEYVSKFECSLELGLVLGLIPEDHLSSWQLFIECKSRKQSLPSAYRSSQQTLVDLFTCIKDKNDGITGETRTHVCRLCPKSFNSTHKLKLHVMTHTGETRYECGTCKKGFIEFGKLKRHMRIHTGEKPYSCATCGKMFNTTSNLKVHNRIHTQERPYVCFVCGRGFHQSGNLKSHMATHNKDPPLPTMALLLAAKSSTAIRDTEGGITNGDDDDEESGLRSKTSVMPCTVFSGDDKSISDISNDLKGALPQTFLNGTTCDTICPSVQHNELGVLISYNGGDLPHSDDHHSSSFNSVYSDNSVEKIALFQKLDAGMDED